MRWLLLAVLLAGLIAACGGDDSEPAESVDTVSTQVAAAVQETMEAQSTDIPDPTATNTEVPPTATVKPTNTPRPINTPKPTRTPRPTTTPTPVDLAQYLPIETDVVGPFTIVRDEEVAAGSFVYKDGFLQGRLRGLAKDEPPLVIVTQCAEYATSQQANESLEQQHTGMMNLTESFTLTEDDGSEIDTENAYLAGGTSYTSDEERPVAIVWYQIERVMCFTAVLGVPGSDAPPRGGAMDAANSVLERLTIAALPTPTAIPGGNDIYEIGQTISFKDGFTLTIKTVENPVVANGEAVSPKTSYVLVAIEVEACAGSSTTGASINPLDFDISLDNNSRADRSYGLVKQPVLDSASLFPGECLSGWVTFERHWEPNPVYIVIDPIGYSTVRVKAR